MEKTEQFMYVYMHLLENYLNGIPTKFKDIDFESDEANTDKPLKEFLKKEIEKNFFKIPNNSGLKQLIIPDGATKLTIDIDTLYEISIKKVLLQDEITTEIKSIISCDKVSTYTKPDMCFEIQMGDEVLYKTIELKATKGDGIPGSSIQQIKPDEWFIFLKRCCDPIKVTTGRYIQAINKKMQFPDRSPRPTVSFETASNWNEANRIITNKSVLEYKDDADNSIKLELLTDWQKVLADRWVDMLFCSNKLRNNDPWFHNTMRKFILQFLEKYEPMSKCRKVCFQNKIKALIKEKEENKHE